MLTNLINLKLKLTEAKLLIFSQEMKFMKRNSSTRLRAGQNTCCSIDLRTPLFTIVQQASKLG